MLPRWVPFLMVVVTASAVPAGETKVPLKVDLPEEVLAGTPPDVLMMLFPGLVMLKAEDMPSVMVPEGTANVAKNKPISASDEKPILGELKFVTDGEKEGSESTFVELAPGKQWVQIDLQEPCEIHAICVWHFFREGRSYHDVVVQVSNDAKFEKDVQTLYSNDQDNSLRFGIGKKRPYIETNLGITIDAKGVAGRYVRVYSQGNTANDLNHYVEVEVHGKPVQ